MRAVLARVLHDYHGVPDADLLIQGRLVQDGEEGVPARAFQPCQLLARHGGFVTIKSAGGVRYTQHPSAIAPLVRTLRIAFANAEGVNILYVGVR